MKPKQFLQHTTKMAKNLSGVRRKSVFVGLPAERAGGKVYGDGMSIIRIGAIHEYGVPGKVPRRSFLREPFRIKQAELNTAIAKEFEAVANGRDIDTGLGRIGALATNVSKGAFVTRGYGVWKEITEQTKQRKGSRQTKQRKGSSQTKQRKGSSQTLIDNGLLRGSITWVVRGK